MSSAKYQPPFNSIDPALVRVPARPRWPVCVLAVLLACSIGFNVMAFNQVHDMKQRNSETLFAGLTYNEEVPWTRENPWHNGNGTAEDHAWHHLPGFDGRVGVVALPSLYAASLGLLPAQHWPWDKSKGIYIIEAMHMIHCLVSIKRCSPLDVRVLVRLIAKQRNVRDVVQDAYAGTPPRHSSEHLSHCIDSIRQFVMCHADDTPRYKGRVFPEITLENPHGGFGQVRMCRDWDRLIHWMMEYDACYRAVPSDTPGFKEEDNYKSCLDGRVLWD